MAGSTPKRNVSIPMNAMPIGPGVWVRWKNRQSVGPATTGTTIGAATIVVALDGHAADR